MTTRWRDRSLLDLLTEFGLELLPEHEFPTDGWSGATFTSLVDSDGHRFVLKRTSLDVDWIARATHDAELREGWFAALPPGALAWIPKSTSPYLGAAADGSGVAILTPDLSNELVAWERPGHDPAIDTLALDRVLRALARLHAVPWASIVDTAGQRDDVPAPPWCPLPERLLLLSPVSAARYAEEGNSVGPRFLEGWEAFRRLAPTGAVDVVDRLAADPAPLLLALEVLPWVGLHGDLKLANVALLPANDEVAFIDWQMTMQAPIAVELGWFLVSNSASLPVAPDEVVRRYRDHLDHDERRIPEGDEPGPQVVGDWDLQRDLTWIIGLLLRGWRKGHDAAAGVRLPSGISAADDLAWWSERATEAAARRL